MDPVKVSRAHEEIVKADERAWDGIPKASGSDLYANALCEGRFLADQSFPSEDTEAAIIGSRTHTYMELGTPLDEIDDDNERYAVERARQMENRMLEEFGLMGEVTREPRMWCMENGEGIFSGCVDRLEVDGKYASIIDYKMLYGEYEPAKTNKQLQVYSVLVFDKYPDVTVCYVGLIQPLLNKATYAKILRSDTVELRRNLIELCKRISVEGAERRPGPKQCKWCTALAHCPEAYEYITEKSKSDGDMESVSNEELAKKMGEVPLFDRFNKEIKALVRNRLEKDIDVPGYKLRSSGKITTFDAEKAGEILFDANMSVEEFLKCCTLKEPQLVKAWSIKTGLTTAEARKDLRLRLENCMTQKAKAKSVTTS